jgi:hypothetical protein
MSYNPTSVIALDTSTGTKEGSPFYYAVMQGQYTRTWTKYFSWTPVPGGPSTAATITYTDNGPGINQYDFSILVTNWANGSLPYTLGVTQSWSTQKANLEASFAKLGPVNNLLYFLDPFGVPPDLNPGRGVYMYKFVETVLDWSTPSSPYLKYDITAVETPSGIIIP